MLSEVPISRSLSQPSNQEDPSPYLAHSSHSIQLFDCVCERYDRVRTLD